jgi:hypothetical protein
MAPQVPSNPDEVMVIRNVTPEIVTLSLPFSPFGGVKFGGRGTLGMRFVFLFNLCYLEMGVKSRN